MSRQYFNRYEFFENDGDFKIVPGIEIKITSSDKYVQFKRGKNRLDKISQEYYGTPVFGWLIYKQIQLRVVLNLRYQITFF